MNTKALLDHAELFFNRCKERLEGTGAEQYYDPKTDTQKFETMEMEELFEYAREEAYDLANYALMIALRVGGMQNQLDDAEVEETLDALLDSVWGDSGPVEISDLVWSDADNQWSVWIKSCYTFRHVDADHPLYHVEHGTGPTRKAAVMNAVAKATSREGGSGMNLREAVEEVIESAMIDGWHSMEPETSLWGHHVHQHTHAAITAMRDALLSEEAIAAGNHSLPDYSQDTDAGDVVRAMFNTAFGADETGGELDEDLY